MENPGESKASRSRYDAVIVGGGHNGLVAAAYLVRAGKRVLVLERNDWIGGATTSVRAFPGFDARLSRFAYLVSLLSPVIIDELGLAFSARRRTIASYTDYERRGRRHGLVLSNVDDAVSRASLAELTGGESGWSEYQAFQQRAQAFAHLVWPGMLQPLRSRAWWKARCTTPLLQEAWHGIVEEPLGRMLERHVHHDVLRGLLFTDAKIGVLSHPDDPSLLQNRCYVYHIIGNGTGEWQVPTGGVGALVEALVSVILDGGSRIVTEAPVVGLERDGRRHAVRYVSGGREHTVEAGRVLLATGARTTARLLGEPYAPREEDEGSVMKVNMLLRRLPVLRSGIDPRVAFTGSFHVDEGYEAMRETARRARQGEVPERPPFETYCHSLTDDSILGPDLVTAGFQTLTLFGLDAPYRTFPPERNEARKADFVERYLAAMDRITVEPFSECLARDGAGSVCLEAKSPLDLEREVDLDMGNIFHTAPSWFFTDDPGEEGTWGVETPFPGIYRCGSSVLRGGAVSGLPGRMAAQCIFSEEGMA
jgi:phytoene dehydrogenase-like protein